MVTALLLLLALFARPEASSTACSCDTPPPDTLLAWAEAVFVGVPVKEKVREVWSEHPRFGRRRVPFEREYRFRILYSWKEPPVDSSSFAFRFKMFWQRLVGAEARDEHSIIVKTGSGGGDCGMVFPEGEPHLVFAGPTLFPFAEPPGLSEPWTDELWTGLCAGTAPLAYTRYDRLILGDPVNDYRLTDDTVTLIDATALSEEEKNEIVGEAAMSVCSAIAEARGRDGDGNFHLWYRPSNNVQWVPIGTVSGTAVDVGDWRAVRGELEELAPHIRADYESRDWGAMAEELRQERVEEAREILAVLEGRLPAAVTPQVVVEGYDVFRGAGMCFVCHRYGIVPGSPTDLKDDIWVQSDGSYEGILGTISEEVYAHSKRDTAYWPEPVLRPRITETQRRALAAYVYVISHPEGLGDPAGRIFDPRR